MVEKPRSGAGKENAQVTTSEDPLSWGFYSGLGFFDLRLVPQIGLRDPAGVAKRSRISAGAGTATEEVISKPSQPEQSGADFLKDFKIASDMGEPGHLIFIPHEITGAIAESQRAPEAPITKRKTLREQVGELLCR